MCLLSLSTLGQAFFRSRLIPGWLSGWGIVAIGLLAAAGVLALFAGRPVTDYVPMALPIFLQEMVLAAWLIANGFSPVRRAAPETSPVAVRVAGALVTRGRTAGRPLRRAVGPS